MSDVCVIQKHIPEAAPIEFPHQTGHHLGETIELSATDLSQFLGCHHRTALDIQVARALRPAPSWADPVLAILRERGLDHERRYADALRATGLRIQDLADAEQEDAPSESLEALRAGFDVLLQPGSVPAVGSAAPTSFVE